MPFPVLASESSPSVSIWSVSRRITMTTSIPAGSGKLNYGMSDCKGEGCKRSSWITSVTFNRCIQKEISCGVVGFGYALEVVKHGSVPVITKVESHESNTNYAQEGVSVGCFLQILWKVICRTPLLSGLIYVTRRLSR